MMKLILELIVIIILSTYLREDTTKGKNALEKILNDTETFEYQDLSNFAKSMTISIISSDKGRFL